MMFEIESYFFSLPDIYPTVINIFEYISILILAILSSVSIYFFSGNKWGSILLSAPIARFYMSIFIRQGLHIYFIILVNVVTYFIIKIVNKAKKT